MAKKQTRRSVSIRGSTYEMVRQYCERNNVSMSEFMEERIASFFGNGAAARYHRKDSEGQSRLSPEQLQDASRFFTF